MRPLFTHTAEQGDKLMVLLNEGKGEHSRKRLEFSQKHVLFANFLVFYVVTLSAILAFLDKIPISDVTIQVIATYGGFATGGYFALCGWRHHSKNKHGVTHGELGISGPHDNKENQNG